MNNDDFSIVDFHWSQDLENEYTQYMANCESTIDAEYYKDTELEIENDFETLSGQPFCGCDVCYIREQLFFLIPRIVEAYKTGKIVVNDEE